MAQIGGAKSGGIRQQLWNGRREGRGNLEREVAFYEWDEWNGWMLLDGNWGKCRQSGKEEEGRFHVGAKMRRKKHQGSDPMGNWE
jgi:hypothetical protein